MKTFGLLMRRLALILFIAVCCAACAGPGAPCRDIYARSLTHFRSLELPEALALQALWADHCSAQVHE